jgi:hypothetical protein
MGMTTNNNYLNYKLHEFFGDEEQSRQLKLLYYEFFDRSRPLDFKSRTLSSRTSKYEQHFKYLTEQTKIFFASVNGSLLGFICFDLDKKTLEIPNGAIEIINPSKTCEFVFAASRNFDRNLTSKAALAIFNLIKTKYDVEYIAGNVRRKYKKEKFIAISKKLFNFKFLEDFAYYEIP